MNFMTGRYGSSSESSSKSSVKMSKSKRNHLHRKSERGSLQILEEAFHLIRSTDVKWFWIYALGVIPFAIGVLYFSTDMSRSSLAGRDAAFAAMGMVLLSFWMHYTRAKFCEGLWKTLNPGSVAQRNAAETMSRLAALWFLQSLQVPLLFIGFFFVIPLGWILATIQNFSALALVGETGGRPLRSLLGKSVRYSHYEWAQNHAILLIFFFVSLFTWINIISSCVLLPGLGKSFFGVESIFTMNPTAAVMNTSFLLGTFLLMQLVMAPFLHAAYVLRCFYADSRSSGADLISRLADCRKKRGNIGVAGPRSLSSGKVAVLTLLIFLSGQTSLHSKETVNLPVDESVQLEPSRLGEEISRTLEQKKYQWQLSRKSVEGESVSEKSWIALRLQEIASSARKAIRSFTNWFEEAWKKLMKRGLKSGGGDRNVDTKFLKELSSMASLALIVLIGGLVLWLMIALYRKHSGKEKIVVSDEGISGMIDLESSDIVATQLLEEEWMRLAREQIAKGEERLAVRALFLATLAHLGERGLLKIVRSKSNRDYRAELRVRSRNSGVIAAAFEENTTLFERVWYGVHHLGQGTVDYYLKNHETIAQESQRAGGQPQEAGR